MLSRRHPHHDARPRPHRARAGAVGAATVLLGVAALCSVAVGTKTLGLDEVWNALMNRGAPGHANLVVWDLRVPRTLIALMVGAALGVSGALIQGLTRNPLADPGILGVQAGAALAVVIAISAFGISTLSGYVWFGFLGATATSVVVYSLGALGESGAAPIRLALCGAAVTALAGSLTSALLVRDVSTLNEFRFWVVGSLQGRGSDVAIQVAPFLAIGFVVAAACGPMLNAIALGDDMARALGTRLGLARATCALAIVLLCGAATAAVGPIAFVGLVIAHVARSIVGADYRWIVPCSAIFGALVLVTADVVGRTAARPGELQVGIVTALIGAPWFVVLVRRRRLASL